MSIFCVEDGIFEVLVSLFFLFFSLQSSRQIANSPLSCLQGTGGDSKELGGRIFDEILTNHFVNEIKKSFGVV